MSARARMAAALALVAGLAAASLFVGVSDVSLSGILHGQEGELLHRYAAWFDQLEAVQDGDWMRITGVRRA